MHVIVSVDGDSSAQQQQHYRPATIAGLRPDTPGAYSGTSSGQESLSSEGRTSMVAVPSSTFSSAPQPIAPSPPPSTCGSHQPYGQPFYPQGHPKATTKHWEQQANNGGSSSYGDNTQYVAYSCDYIDGTPVEYHQPQQQQFQQQPQMLSVSVGKNARIAPCGLEIKVGSAQVNPATVIVPRTPSLLAQVPRTQVAKNSKRRGSDSSSSEVGSTTASSSTKATTHSSTNKGGLGNVPAQLRAQREKHTKREKSQQQEEARQKGQSPSAEGVKTTAATPQKRGERLRAPEGPIPVHERITMKTPFFIPAGTPVTVCSSRDGVWRKGFTWRDNTRRVVVSSLAETDTEEEGPTFMRSADIALFDAKGCPCDLDALHSRPCYVRIDPEAMCSNPGGVDLYWKNGHGGDEFSPVQVHMLNYMLGGGPASSTGPTPLAVSPGSHTPTTSNGWYPALANASVSSSVTGASYISGAGSNNNINPNY